jgi:hypothetical protein
VDCAPGPSRAVCLQFVSHYLRLVHDRRHGGQSEIHFLGRPLRHAAYPIYTAAFLLFRDKVVEVDDADGYRVLRCIAGDGL